MSTTRQELPMSPNGVSVQLLDRMKMLRAMCRFRPGHFLSICCTLTPFRKPRDTWEAFPGSAFQEGAGASSLNRILERVCAAVRVV